MSYAELIYASPSADAENVLLALNFIACLEQNWPFMRKLQALMEFVPVKEGPVRYGQRGLQSFGPNFSFWETLFWCTNGKHKLQESIYSDRTDKEFVNIVLSLAMEFVWRGFCTRQYSAGIARYCHACIFGLIYDDYSNKN